MKCCFIAFVLFFFSYNLKAQYAIVGANLGAGVLANSNASYFPGFGGHAKAGLTLGLMVTDHFGFVTGVNSSYFNFDISYGRGIVANQSLTYLDVPFSIRYLMGKTRNHHKTRAYAQSGILLRSLRRAHYKPGGSGSTQSHITYAQDNNGEFKKTTISPFLQVGFIWKLSNVADLNMGFEFSTATKNTVTNLSYNLDDKMIQGYAANMNLIYAAIQLALQFHLGDSRARK